MHSGFAFSLPCNNKTPMIFAIDPGPAHNRANDFRERHLQFPVASP